MSEGGELDQVEAWISGMMAKLGSAQRQQLARRIGIDIRRRNVSRIQRQVTPDGDPFTPRRPREGVKRVRAMFPKLRQGRYLRIEASAGDVAIGYPNPGVARVARIHQYGLRDRVSKEDAAAEVTYAARAILGLPDADRARVIDLVLDHVFPGDGP